ncbi:hypothetical protein [Neobacillus sp. 114]|uniref:hypothetical protein n=1 Tax=Neobacillus sp. 114 TaxID=3048535 RepID=UPI0024C32D5F|nr:hypothetical protein [Neobacillus sp. 114]
MGFFTSLFGSKDNNQKQGSKPATSYSQNQRNTPDFNDETNKLIGQLYSQLAGRINSYQQQTQINQILLTKRQRTNNSNDYIDVLINNVTYFTEMEKEMLKILERMFNEKRIPSFSQVEEEIVGIQNRKKQQMPSLTSQSKIVYNNKFSTNNQKIEALQFDYAYHSLVHELIIDTIDALTNNHSFTNQLFRSSSKYNIDTINRYLSTHANIKLENITFTGSR